MKYHFIALLRAKAFFYFQLLLTKWNTFFDPAQVLEQEQIPSMPEFQIDSFIEKAIQNNIPVKINVQAGQHTESIEGQLFKDFRHQDTFFMTTPENRKLIRIIFKKQITAISTSGSFKSTIRTASSSDYPFKLRKTS